MNNTLLIDETHPAVCRYHDDNKYLVFQVEAKQNNPFEPDVSSLSVSTLSSKLENDSDNYQLDSTYKERLEDAVRSVISSKDEDQNLGLFVKRCDALFCELAAAFKTSSKLSSTESSSNLSCYSSEVYRHLVSELEMIGWEKVRIEDEVSLSRFTLLSVDGKGREHPLHIRISPSFPQSPPACTFDLPEPFTHNWIINSSGTGTNISSSQQFGLIKLYEEFKKSIATFQDFWDELDDIDSQTWVLEPILPARREISERRLVLKVGLSISIKLDTNNNPRGIPISVRFIGPSNETALLRNTYNVYVSGKVSTKRWTDKLSVRENLQNCFDLVLPSPDSSEKTEYVIECGICYSHRLMTDDHDDQVDDGCLPDASCENKACGRSYHETCLFEWLHSLPTAKTSFDRIFGTCPYCCEPISVKAR